MSLPNQLKVKKAPSMREIILHKTDKFGGEGTLYTIEGDNSVVAKIFNSPKIAKKKEQKIEALIQLQQKIQASNNGQLITNITLPLARLYDQNGSLVGFMMRYIDTRQTFFLEDFIENDRYRVYNSSNFKHSAALKSSVAHNLCAVVAEFHKFGAVIGDLNPRNVLIWSNCAVTLLDADGIQYSYFALDAIHPLVRAPEVGQMGVLPCESDCFALSILLYRIFMCGFHPFSTVNHPDIPENIRQGITPVRNTNLKLPFGCPPLGLLGNELFSAIRDSLDPYPQNRPQIDTLINAIHIWNTQIQS